MPNRIDPEAAAHNRAVIDAFRADPTDERRRRLVLLTTTGARTGRRHTTALMHSMDGDRVVVVGSTYGNDHHPAWYYNVLAHPVVTVELGGATFEARAEVAEGDERERLFRQHASTMPYFEDYQRRVTRVIPVVVLTRL